MATSLSYLSGSDRIGSPLVIRATAATLSSPADNPVTFHNLICEVTVALVIPDDTQHSDHAPLTFTLSRPVNNDGETVDIDISSALRSVADRYQPEATHLQTPYVTTAADTAKYPAVTVYDEYMQGGIVTTQHGKMTLAQLPTNDNNQPRMYLGAYTDLERLLAPRDQKGEAWLGLNTSSPRPISALTRKPSTTDEPELVPLGCTHIYPSSIGASTAFTPNAEGLCIPSSNRVSSNPLIEGKAVFVFSPRPLERFLTIRFLNGLGLMETVHVRTGRKQQQHMQSQQHLRALMESFGSPGRSYYTKSHLRQEWQLSTGPITETWLHWYAHDFLLTPAAWINLSDIRAAVNGQSSRITNHSSSNRELWIPIHIKPDDTLDLLSTNETETLPVFTFTIQFDLDGPVLI